MSTDSADQPAGHFPQATVLITVTVAAGALVPAWTFKAHREPAGRDWMPLPNIRLRPPPPSAADTLARILEADGRTRV